MLQNKIWAFQTAFSVVFLSIGFSFVYNKFKGDLLQWRKLLEFLLFKYDIFSIIQLILQKVWFAEDFI